MEKIRVPGIFIGSMRDQLVPFKQVEELFKMYRSKKEMFLIEEEHNEPRSKASIEKVFRSIKKHTNMTEHEAVHMQTEADESVKPKKKLNLTLKCYSQKDLGCLKNIDRLQKPSK